MLETVKINAEANPDNFINAYFYPFKGTVLFGVCMTKGYLVRSNITSFFERPALDLDTVAEHQIMFIYKHFYVLVKLYKSYMRLPKVLSAKLINITDRLLTYKNFPYGIFNSFYDIVVSLKRLMINCLRKHPRAYDLSRNIRDRIKAKL